LIDPSTIRSADNVIGLDDFYAVPASDLFMFMPTREMWPGRSVNGVLPAIQTSQKRNGKYLMLKPISWLRQFRRVEQVTWMPGSPEIIQDWLIFDGGWQERPGVRWLNLYRPPRISLGDSSKATPWVDHLKALYPEDAEHITDFLAHRIQRHGQKPNHVLALGGGQGIGKDTLLEPIKVAVGPWKYHPPTCSNHSILSYKPWCCV
jgi:hypothetical protein